MIYRDEVHKEITGTEKNVEILVTSTGWTRHKLAYIVHTHAATSDMIAHTVHVYDPLCRPVESKFQLVRRGSPMAGLLGCHGTSLSVQVLCTALTNYLLYKTIAIMMGCFCICMLRSMIYEPNGQTEEEGPNL